MNEIMTKIDKQIRDRGFCWYKVTGCGMNTDKNGIFYFVKYDAGNRCKTVQGAVARVYVKESEQR